MIATSAGIVYGTIEKQYGKYGQQFLKGMPTYSLPLKIADYPPQTKSFAIVMEDKDAIAVAGFSWLHWAVANLTRDELQENESVGATDFIQGTNSWSSKLLPDHLDRYEAAVFGGCAPPDKPHVYEIHVYALDCELPLKQGFYVNELYKAMAGHVLDSYTLTGIYNN